MLHVTDIAHRLLRPVIGPGAWVVDATAGNGHDTAFLAQCVGPTGRVFGFDVQAQALAATAEHVRGLAQVTLFHAGHEQLRERLPAEAQGRLAAVMFNLGYLPGGPKQMTTKAETTLAALSHALDFLAVGGLLTLAMYPGYPAGRLEADAVRTAACQLPAAFAATMIERLNANSAAPQLLTIERIR